VNDPERTAAWNSDPTEQTGPHSPSSGLLALGGRLVKGRYEPLRIVGRGGQGEVILAHDHQHDRSVALKVRAVPTSADRDYILREARVLLELTPHVGVPLVREDFFEEDHYVLVMDWIEGRSLDRLLDEEGGPGLPLATVVGWLDQIAAALDHLHAHTRPVIHQDVKPGNIVVTPEGRAVLVDFGISRGRRDEAYPGGTLAYLAPELIVGGEPSPASDVFALAVTAHRLLTGSVPEPGVTPDWTSVPDVHRQRVSSALDAGLALHAAGRPASAGALLALLRPPATPHNLPTFVSSFIGRNEELREIQGLLDESRLVTLVGAGGCGKTRVAVATASSVLADFPDGVFLVDLAPVSEPDLVPQTVARAVGVREQPGRQLVDVLTNALREGTYLVLMDNCEHLIDAVAVLTETLLQASPSLRVLATSREPIRIDGETTWPVPALGLPKDQELPRAILDTESARLFVDRARSVRPDLDLGDADASAVAQICNGLDGIPLALELAAASLRSMDVQEVADRLDDRFSLLTDGRRTALPRHRTLRGAVEWSHDLLSDDEKVALRRLGVFAGTFSEDAASGVCGPDGLSDVPRILLQLVDASLLVRDGQHRFHMLETIREYARERLEAAGERTEIADRHGHWFRSMVEDAEPELFGPRQADLLAALETDHDNIRSALSWWVRESPQPVSATQLASALGRFWMARGHLAEGRMWLESTLHMSDTEASPLRAKNASAAGGIAHLQGDLDAARAHHEEALKLCRAIGMAQGVASSLSNLGALASMRGDYSTAIELSDEAVRIFRDLGDRAREAQTLANLGAVAYANGDLERARTYLEQALQVVTELGDVQTRAKILTNLGGVARAQADFGSARTHLEESLSVKHELGDRQGIAAAYNALGDLALAEGDAPIAVGHHRRAIELFNDLGDQANVALSMTALALALAHGGRADQAARLFGAAETMRTAVGATIVAADREPYEDGIRVAREQLGTTTFEAARTRGRSMTSEHAIAEVLAGDVSDVGDRTPLTDVGDASRVVEDASRAGDRALARLEYEQAVSHYEWAIAALQLMEKPPVDLHISLLIALADTHQRFGDVARARPLYLRAAEPARLRGDADALARCAIGYAAVLPPIGVVDDVRAGLLTEALATTDTHDHATRARILAHLAMGLYWSDDLDSRAALSESALTEARASSDDLTVAQVLANVTLANWGPDNLESRATTAREVLALAERANSRELGMQGQRMRIISSFEVHDIRDVDAALMEHGRLAVESRNNGYLWENMLFRATRALLAGRFEDAEQLAERALEAGTSSQGDNAMNLYLVQLFFIRRDQGRLDELEPLLRDFIEQNPHVRAWRYGLTYVLAALGRTSEARQELDDLGSRGFTDHPRDFLWLVDMCLVADAVATVHDVERAAALYNVLKPYERRWAVVANAAACADSVTIRLGRLSATVGRYDDAVRHLEDALATAIAIGARPAVARAQLHLARALTSRGSGKDDTSAAAALLEEAIMNATDLGMRAVADTARALRHLGPVGDHV
jgi:non-specific serine/threonine protein kinase